MELLVALLFLGLLAIGILIGIAVNVYLYSNGAFGMRYIERMADIGAMSWSQEDDAITYGSTGDGPTLRRIAMFAFIVVTAVSMLFVYLASFAGR